MQLFTGKAKQKRENGTLKRIRHAAFPKSAPNEKSSLYQRDYLLWDDYTNDWLNYNQIKNSLNP